MKGFEGVFPILNTTFSSDGALDLESQQRLADHLLQSGVHGLGLLANASEGYTLASEERTFILKLVGKQAGLSQQAFEDCFKDQALIDKLTADREFAVKVLKVRGTPTFFINGEMFEGDNSFEEFEKRIKPLLKS